MRLHKVHRCGAMDSKYFSNPQQFEKDVEQNRISAALFKKRLRELVLEDPNKIEDRYHQVIETMMEIKAEFGL